MVWNHQHVHSVTLSPKTAVLPLPKSYYNSCKVFYSSSRRRQSLPLRDAQGKGPGWQKVAQFVA